MTVCRRLYDSPPRPLTAMLLHHRAIALRALKRLDEALPLAAIRRAHERLEAGDVRGKLVLVP